MKIDSAQHLLQIFSDVMGFSPEWSSSALNLDKALSAAGYNVPNFFHNYKLPISKEVLEQQSNEMLLFAALNNNVKKIADVYGEYIEISDSVNTQLEKTKSIVYEKIVKFTEEIKVNNPELAKIQTPRLIDKVHFIRGVVYGYPPENIKFWIENYPNDNVFNESLNLKRILKEKFKIDTGLIRLTKKQTEDLLLRVEEQSKNKFYASQKNLELKIEELDDLGRSDSTGFLRFMQERDDDL